MNFELKETPSLQIEDILQRKSGAPSNFSVTVQEFSVKHHNSGDRKIGIDLYKPGQVEKKNKSIILFPGFTIRKKELKNIAKKLCSDGYLVWAVDFSVAEITHSDFSKLTISQLIREVKIAIDFVCKQELVDKKQIYAAGHSMGSFSLLLYLSRTQDPRIRAVVAINPVHDVIEVSLNCIGQFLKFAKIPTALFDKTRNIIKNSIIFLWKLSGKLMVFKKDKRGSVHKQFLWDIMEINHNERIKKDLSRLKTPCLLLHSEKDTWVKYDHVHGVYSKLQTELKTIGVIKDAQHNPFDEAAAERIAEHTLPWFDHFSYSLPEEISRSVRVFGES